MAPRENENNAYAKFWGDKQRALWYVMIFSGVVNYFSSCVSVRRCSHDRALMTHSIEQLLKHYYNNSCL